MGECRLSGACAEEPRPKSLTTRSSPDQRRRPHPSTGCGLLVRKPQCLRAFQYDEPAGGGPGHHRHAGAAPGGGGAVGWSRRVRADLTVSVVGPACPPPTSSSDWSIPRVSTSPCPRLQRSTRLSVVATEDVRIASLLSTCTVLRGERSYL